MLNDHTLYEKELLLRVAGGDEQSFRQLFDAYRPKLYTYLLKLTESPETAEDLVHDVFLKLWLKKENFAEVENFSAYLYRMAHNQAITGLRRMSTETLVLAEVKYRDHNIPEEPAYTLQRKEVQEFIQQAVQKLTPKQKEAFILSKELGLRQAEIASRMGIGVGTVKTHLQEAVKQLRAEIKAKYGDHAIALFVLWNLCP